MDEKTIYGFVRRIRDRYPYVRNRLSSMWVPKTMAALWHWGATWRWYDAIFGVGFAVSMSIHEYALAFTCLVLCAFSLVSILWHEKKRGTFFKSMGTLFVCVALVFLTYVTIQEKEQRDWSHLTPLFYRTPKPRHPMPPTSDWYSTQRFETQVKAPEKKQTKTSEPRSFTQPSVTQTCTGSNCIGVNNGTATQTVVDTPPLKLTWSASPAEPTSAYAFRQNVAVVPNVAFYPVSLIVVCSEEINDIQAYGAFQNVRWGITNESKKIGYIYYENPPLAPGVSLSITISSTKPFSILGVEPHKIEFR